MKSFFTLYLIAFLAPLLAPAFANTPNPYMVKDINSGSSYTNFYNNGVDPFTLNGSYYFFAETPEAGVELWRTDRTEAGTYMVKDINPGTGSSSITSPFIFNNKVYFRAYTPTEGNELWVSDGTSDGTHLVKDIYPGGADEWNPYSSDPYQFTVLGNAFYFYATTPDFGIELWKSDGTESGTVLVKDINPGAESSYPDNFYVVGSEIFFKASDGTHGSELWKTDGSTEGTSMIKDISDGGDTYSNYYVVMSDVLYMALSTDANGWELWRTNGTDAGTYLIKDINSEGGLQTSSNPSDLTVAGSTLYFSATDGLVGTELWKTDGTESGTVLVKDINLGESSSSPYSLKFINGKMFFWATTAEYGTEPWVSNGTESGTFMLKDINAGVKSSAPEDSVYAYNNKAVFPAFGQSYDTIPLNVTARYVKMQGIQRMLTWGYSIWEMEVYGSENPSVNLALHQPAVSSDDYGSWLLPTYATDGDFSSRWAASANGSSDKLDDDWIYVDLGSSVPLDKLKILWEGAYASKYAIQVSDDAENWTTLYTNNSSNGGMVGYEPFESDGTVLGTHLIADINPNGSSYASWFKSIGNNLFFKANSYSSDELDNYELYKYNGTTVEQIDIWEGPAGSYPNYLYTSGNNLMFTADNGIYGTELWTYTSVAGVDETPDEPSDEATITFDFSKGKSTSNEKYPYGTKIKLTNTSGDNIVYQWVKGWNKDYNLAKWKVYKNRLKAPEGKYTLFVKVNDIVSKREVETNNRKEVYNLGYDINSTTKTITLNWKIHKYQDDIKEVRIYRSVVSAHDLTNQLGKNKVDDTTFVMNSSVAWNSYDYYVVAYDFEGNKINSKMVTVLVK